MITNAYLQKHFEYLKVEKVTLKMVPVTDDLFKTVIHGLLHYLQAYM